MFCPVWVLCHLTNINILFENKNKSWDLNTLYLVWYFEILIFWCFDILKPCWCTTILRALGNLWPCYTLDTPLGFHGTCPRSSSENKIHWCCPVAMDPHSLFYSFRSPCTHTRNWLHLLCRPFLQYGRQLLSDLDVSVLDDHRPHLRSWSTRCCNRHTRQGCLDIDPRSCWGSSFPEKYLLH